MAYKQNPGRGPMQKTGNGIPSALLQDESFGSAFKAAKGKDFTYKGKQYSGLTKEKAEQNLEEGNRNIADFQGKNPRVNASHYITGKDTGNYMYYPLMGRDNAQINKNVQSQIDKQKKAAHALNRGGEATKFENPFKGY
jgi:hypothetical protein